MPKKNVILNLPGFTITKMSNFNPIIYDVKYHRKPRCVHCNGKNLRKKDSFFRTVKHESVGMRNSVIRFKAYKFYCRDCARYFNQQFPGILKYQRATQKLKNQVFHLHASGVSQKHLAKRLNVGKATIERWFHQLYFRKNQEILNRACPQVLGIDEHHFSKKHGFATTFCDLKNHRVFDIVQGRSQVELKPYLQQLPEKHKVKAICIDLCSTFKRIAKQYFPYAAIIADRFHVIRLMNHHVMQTFHQINQSLKYQRKHLQILRMHHRRLNPKQQQRLNNYLDSHPAIAAIYHFKCRLHDLLNIKMRTARQCQKLIPRLLNAINQLKSSGFEKLRKLGRTLYAWREEIARMWRFTKNNGITEGFHRKMKLIQRRAYGFRNFENYRLRVRVLCS